MLTLQPLVNLICFPFKLILINLYKRVQILRDGTFTKVVIPKVSLQVPLTSSLLIALSASVRLNVSVCPVMLAKVLNKPETGVTGLVTTDELKRLLFVFHYLPLS